MDDRDYFADQLGQIFSDLRKHYEENYDDMALRLGNIVLLLEEIQVLAFRCSPLALLFSACVTCSKSI